MFDKDLRAASGQFSDNCRELDGGGVLFLANPQSSSEDGPC